MRAIAESRHLWPFAADAAALMYFTSSKLGTCRLIRGWLLLDIDWFNADPRRSIRGRNRVRFVFAAYLRFWTAPDGRQGRLPETMTVLPPPIGMSMSCGT